MSTNNNYTNALNNNFVTGTVKQSLKGFTSLFQIRNL